jgi:hypothetical protein
MAIFYLVKRQQGHIAEVTVVQSSIKVYGESVLDIRFALIFWYFFIKWLLHNFKKKCE